MKKGIHPEYKPATIVCSCGNRIETRSTREEIHVEICSVCHPFYTGRQKLVDTAGRVERFKRKYGDTSTGEVDAEDAPADEETPAGEEETAAAQEAEAEGVGEPEPATDGRPRKVAAGAPDEGAPAESSEEEPEDAEEA